MTRSITRRGLAPLLAVLALPCLPAAAQETASPVLSCTGPLGADTSHAKLVAAFGKDNVVWTQVDGAEGEKIGATVLYPKDAKKRLEFFWADDKTRQKLSLIRPARDNKVAAQNGLRPGLSIAEVEKLNGQPFALYGFEWDDGGTVTDWKGGALDTPPPGGCIVSVRFALPPGVAEKAASAVAGDHAFSSDAPAIKAAKPIVVSIGFGYSLH